MRRFGPRRDSHYEREGKKRETEGERRGSKRRERRREEEKAPPEVLSHLAFTALEEEDSSTQPGSNLRRNC